MSLKRVQKWAQNGSRNGTQNAPKLGDSDILAHGGPVLVLILGTIFGPHSGPLSDPFFEPVFGSQPL